MWQLLTLTALFFGSTEQIIDKIVVVGYKTMDTLVASFYRNFVYFVIAVVLGLTGVFGKVQIFFSWPILLLALLSIGNAIFYTYLLKNIELTGSAAIGYATPFLFLLIDVFVVKSPINALQITGVILLIAGGLIFSISPETFRIKKEYTKYIWGIFLFEMVCSGIEYYTFKHYNSAIGLNEVSYLISTWLLVSVGFVILIALFNKWRKLRPVATHDHFLAKETASKFFDFINSLLWLRALTLTAVSKVNALASFEPLMLLILLYIVHRAFKLKTGEKFDRRSAYQKIFATSLLILGAFLAS